MNGKFDILAGSFQLVHKIFNQWLCLGQSHAISRYNDNFRCISEPAGVNRNCIFDHGLCICLRGHCTILFNQGFERFLGVSQEQGDLIASFLFIERVVNTGISRQFVIVHDDDMFGILYIQDRHTVNRSACRRISCRVDHVIGSDNDDHISLGKAGIDLFHLMKLLIGHINFSQQHIHVTGHTAGDRVNGKFDILAGGFQLVHKIFNQWLCLGQSHSVSRYNDDLLCIFEPGGVGRAAVRSLDFFLCRAAACTILFNQGFERFLGVSQEQGDLIAPSLGIERVVNTGISRLFVIVHDDNVFGIFYVQDRHTVNRGACRRISCRVDHVVGSDNDDHISLGKLGIDLFHLMKLLIGHINFSQQHIHVAGHTAGHRMNGKFDVLAGVFQLIHKIFNQWLCLGQSHTISRYNDDLLCISEPGGVGRTCLYCIGDNRLSCSCLHFSSGCCCSCIFLFGLHLRSGSFAKQDIHQFAVHGTAHNLRQKQSGSSDYSAD